MGNRREVMAKKRRENYQCHMRVDLLVDHFLVESLRGKQDRDNTSIWLLAAKCSDCLIIILRVTIRLVGTAFSAFPIAYSP